MHPFIYFLKKKQFHYFQSLSYHLFLVLQHLLEGGWSETNAMSQAPHYWSRTALQYFVYSLLPELLFAFLFLLPWNLDSLIWVPGSDAELFPMCLSYPPFHLSKHFCKRCLNHYPLLYLAKLRHREVKLFNTRAGELCPPPCFWDEHFHKRISTKSTW